MKILLLGSTGMLGSVVYEELFKRGHEVICPTHQECDISNYKSVDFQLTASINMAINCAGIIPSAPGKLDIKDHDVQMILVNALWPQFIASVCYERGIRLVLVSAAC